MSWSFIISDVGTLSEFTLPLGRLVFVWHWVQQQRIAPRRHHRRGVEVQRHAASDCSWPPHDQFVQVGACPCHRDTRLAPHARPLPPVVGRWYLNHGCDYYGDGDWESFYVNDP